MRRRLTDRIGRGLDEALEEAEALVERQREIRAGVEELRSGPLDDGRVSELVNQKRGLGQDADELDNRIGRMMENDAAR